MLMHRWFHFAMVLDSVRLKLGATAMLVLIYESQQVQQMAGVLTIWIASGAALYSARCAIIAVENAIAVVDILREHQLDTTQCSTMNIAHRVCEQDAISSALSKAAHDVSNKIYYTATQNSRTDDDSSESDDDLSKPDDDLSEPDNDSSESDDGLSACIH